MPKTRHEVDRDDKIDEILDEAERQLREGGADALSVNAVAKAVGIAGNSVYWYFPSRDHVLVGVLERALDRIISSKLPKNVSQISHAAWILDKYEEFGPLRAVMKERALSSPVVEEFAERLDELLRSFLEAGLRPYVVEKELSVSVDAVVAVIEGLADQRYSRARRRRALKYALGRFAAPAAGGATEE